MAALAALVLAVLPATGAGAASSPETISLPAYVTRLSDVRQLAEEDAAHPSSQAMGAVRRSLGLPLVVLTDAGAIRVPPDSVLDSLQGTRSGDFLKAADHLATLEDAAQGALGAPQPDGAREAAALAAAYAGITARPGLLARLRHDAWVSLLSAWQWLRGLFHGKSWLGNLIAYVSVVVVLGLAVLLARRLRHVVPEAGGQATGRRRRSQAVDWDRVAEEALARGDLDAAIRARYQALLAALAARGVIPRAPSLTAGECRRAVAANLPGAYPAVARATAIFESTVYGRSPADRSEVDALQDAQRSVTAA